MCSCMRANYGLYIWKNNSSVDILHVVAEEIHDIAYIIQVTVIDVRKHLCNV